MYQKECRSYFTSIFESLKIRERNKLVFQILNGHYLDLIRLLVNHTLTWTGVSPHLSAIALRSLEFGDLFFSKSDSKKSFVSFGMSVLFLPPPFLSLSSVEIWVIGDEILDKSLECPDNLRLCSYDDLEASESGELTNLTSVKQDLAFSTLNSSDFSKLLESKSLADSNNS